MIKRHTVVLISTIFLLVFHSSHIVYGQKKDTIPAPSKLDVVFVLDNSGSMKTNDPQFLTRKVVSNFLEGLSGDARIGFVIFAERAELAMSLTPVAGEGIRKKITKTLNNVNYRGRYTNIPAAIERAIYELKQNGREDAERQIIFLTDGIIDTGDRAKDIEKHRWLKDELAEEAKRAGIRIFGIAFTDQADFELIQTLGQKTGGDYYRALKAEDIQGVFNDIQQAILRPRLKPGSPPTQPKKGLPEELLLVVMVGLIILCSVAIFLATRKKKEGVIIRPLSEEDTKVPAAMLIDINETKVTGQVSHKISKRITKIGRVGKDEKTGKQVNDIVIPRDTISAFHATIEYRDHNFYLVDQRSSNGTLLNGQQVTGEVRLKSGDEIVFDQRFGKYKFRFMLPDQGERGGTRLDSVSLKGGTVLVGPAPPDKSPDQTPIAPLPEADENKGTEVKPASCPVHPSFNATELCYVCKKAYCSNCITEKDGRMVCRRCAENKTQN